MRRLGDRGNDGAGCCREIDGIWLVLVLVGLHRVVDGDLDHREIEERDGGRTRGDGGGDRLGGGDVPVLDGAGESGPGPAQKPENHE